MTSIKRPSTENMCTLKDIWQHFQTMASTQWPFDGTAHFGFLRYRPTIYHKKVPAGGTSRTKNTLADIKKKNVSAFSLPTDITTCA